MTQNELLAYAAGIVDGEGCVGAWKAHNHKRAVSPSAQITVRVEMATPFVVKLLHELFGGSLRLAPKQPNRKQKFTWSVVSRKAEACLMQLLPYLREKREQAETALALASLRRPRNDTHRPLTAEELAAREAYVARLKELKRQEYAATALQ